jgi:hypothetical protein
MTYVTFHDLSHKNQYVVRSFHTAAEADEFKNDLITYNQGQKTYADIQIKKELSTLPTPSAL